MSNKAEFEQKLGRITLMVLFGIMSAVCYFVVGLAVLKVFLFALDLPELRTSKSLTSIMWFQSMGYLVVACIAWFLPTHVYSSYLKKDTVSEQE